MSLKGVNKILEEAGSIGLSAIGSNMDSETEDECPSEWQRIPLSKDVRDLSLEELKNFVSNISREVAAGTDLTYRRYVSS